jgi:signal transduction histidine kinase
MEQGGTETRKIGHFSVDSQLLLELGERLVTKRSIALAELVKNSYDADSPRCTITLEKVTEKNGRIIVEDSGIGIDESTFNRSWLRIATTDSRDKPLSPHYFRPRTGEKGVGRFACRVLANKLVLESVSESKSGDKNHISAVFDWNTFKPGSDVGGVNVEYTIKSVAKSTQAGTTITLEDVREIWKEKDIEDLRKELLQIVSPFPVEERPTDKGDPGFEIILKAHEFGPEKNLREEIFKAAIATLTGEIGAKGIPLYSVQFRGDKTSIPWTPSDTYFTQVGPAKFKIHFLQYEQANFYGVKITLAFARDLGREQGGVRIYMDGFRVAKYGDPSDDWLELDSDKAKRSYDFPGIPDELQKGLGRPELSIPGNNNLFGVVNISRFQNPNLAPLITRDRLVDNDAFSQLRGFVRLGIDWMVIQYLKRRQQVTSPEAQKKADVERAIQTVRKSIDFLKESTQDRPTQNAIANLETAQQRIMTALQEQIDAMMMLRVLASTGTMILIFEHELGTIVSKMSELSHALAMIPKGATTNGAIQEARTSLDEMGKDLNELGMHVGLLIGTSSREARRSMAIKESADESMRPFKHHMETYDITFVNLVPANLRTPKMFPCEFYSILVNLFTNSIKAVKNTTSRKIGVAASKKGDLLEVAFLDTGPGIPNNIRERVFEPFSTTSKPDPFLGQGTGLGLKIVRDIMASYAGTARFIDPPSGWATCLLLTFPTKEV